MKVTGISAVRRVILASAATLALAPSAAFAQDASDAENEEVDEIVVTGTILRGVAPVGSQLISVGAEKVQSQGATTAIELMATVPQVSNLFNNVPTARLGVASNQIPVVRPNLRNLAN